MLIIVFPTEYEAGELVSRLFGKQKTKIGGVPCYRGILHEKIEVLVVICGMGAAMAQNRIKRVLAQEKTGTVILTGFGGALVPELKVGQVIVANNYGSTALLERIQHLPGSTTASLHTADVVISTPEEKKSLALQSGCQVVDMEMSAVAALIGQTGHDLVGIRVISDGVEDTVPSKVLSYGYNTAKGCTTPIRMMFYLCLHPWQLGKLKGFLAPLAACRHRLTDFLVAVVKEITV